MALLNSITRLVPGRTAEQTPTASSDDATDGLDTAETGAPPGHDATPADSVEDSGRGAVQATRVAPSGVRLESDIARAGTRWVKCLFITGYPECATPGLLDRVCTHPSADVDVTIYAAPKNLQQSLRKFESAIKSLKIDRAEARDLNSPKEGVLERRITEHELVYQQLQANAQQVLNVGVYLTIRGDSKEQVESVATTIRGDLERKRLTAKQTAYRQADALVTGSPVAKDALDHTTPMLGHAAGALFPFSATTTIEECGVLYGYHASTGAPVYLDRFQRKNGHNVLITGEIGSGKTYNTSCLLLRRLAKDRETDVVMIDPVGDFASLARNLDAEHYVIGGNRTVNPLEIRPTPGHLIEAQNVDPFNERISGVMDFFETFFAYVGAPLGDRRQVLERCVREAYHWRGITSDPTTHDAESPVIGDVRDILGDLAQDPTTVLEDEYTAGELEKWQDHAEDLRLNFEPFTTGGQFAFLNGPTEVDFTDSRVIYLDLDQFSGRTDNALAGLVMQPMFDAVYERLKTAPNRTILAIDEAHYLVETPGSVEWLKRKTRHSRHLDLSMHFVTQELDDFYAAGGAETFVNQSSIKILHRQGGLKDRHTDTEALGLTETQAEFVRDAVIGDEHRGYSHALLDVDEGGTYPIRVTALDEEESIIEGDGVDITSRDTEWTPCGETSVHTGTDAAADGGTRE